MDELEASTALHAYILQLRQLLLRMQPEERSAACALVKVELRDLEPGRAPTTVAVAPPVPIIVAAESSSSALAVAAGSPRRPSLGSPTNPLRLSRITQAVERVLPDAPRTVLLTGLEECTAAPIAAPVADEVPSAAPVAADVPAASWRESSGRADGADAYQLGDAARSVFRWAAGHSSRASSGGASTAAIGSERRLSIAMDPRPARPRTGFEEAAPTEERGATEHQPEEEEPGPAEIPPPHSPGLPEGAAAAVATPHGVHRGVSLTRAVVTGTRGRPIAEAEAYAPLEWTLLWEEQLAKEEANGGDEEEDAEDAEGAEGEGGEVEQGPQGEEEKEEGRRTALRLVPSGETTVIAGRVDLCSSVGTEDVCSL